MKIIKQSILFLCVLLMSSCTYDSESDLIDAGNMPLNPSGLINYTSNVAPIVQNACIACHASPPVNGAPFSLVNYDQVNQRANTILNRISLQNGAPGAMPPSGRLPQATIDIIEQWITDGKQEN